MKILALDSSGLVASVAVVEDEKLLAEYTVNYKKTHSQTLLPMLDEIGKMIDLDLSTIDAIAVAAGPGSFTGLRIGSATAKGLGLALDKPLMDARRSQVYTGVYAFDDRTLKVLKPQMAISVEELTDLLNGMGREVLFLGDGVPVYQALIDEKMKVPYHYVPAHLNKQRAAAVAALGEIYFREGKIEHARDHQPDYLRLSQAERERAEAEKQAAEQKTC